MRLVQLARKLGITQNEIINFLSGQGIETAQSGNSKLEEKHVELILDYFGRPGDQVEEPVSSTDDQLAESPASSDEAPASPELSKTEDANAVVTEALESSTNQDEQEPQEKEELEIEVIRAKKIKLGGIKVLGKIELPEPPKKAAKEAVSEDQQNDTSEKIKKPNKHFKDRHSQKRNRPKRKKEETYEQKLKRQEKEAQKKKKEREKRLKLKKKRFYEEQIKGTNPEKIKKKSPKKRSEPSATVKKKVIRHKNPVIRLWEWLNGKYD